MAVGGRVAVVTGGARGMGREFVKGFLSEGYKVAALDLGWDGVPDLPAKEVAPGELLTLAADITSDAQVDDAYGKTIERFGSVDVLVNNAAMRMKDIVVAGHLNPLESKISDWERMFAVNVFGTLRATRRFIAPMMEKRSGSIINISTGAAIRPYHGDQPYAASKAALNNLTYALADYLKPWNIAANMVLPTVARTTGYEEQAAARSEMGIVLRPPVKPEANVPIVLFLAQQDATGVTGEALRAMEYNEEHGLGDYESWISAAPAEV